MGKKKSKKKDVQVSGEKSKKRLALTIIAAVVTVALAIGSGWYYANGAYKQGYDNYAKDTASRVLGYDGMLLKVDKDTTADAFDSKMRAKDDTYKGLVSQDAVLSAEYANAKGKSAQTVAFVYDDRLLFDDVLIKNTTISIPDGSYAVYTAGYEWDGVSAGTAVTLRLPTAAGTFCEIRAVVAGSFNYNQLMGTAFVGAPLRNAYRSAIAVEGLDLTTLYASADNNVIAFSKAKMRDVVADEDLGVGSGMSLQYASALSADMQNANDGKINNSFVFETYMFFIIFALMMVIIFFLGGRYRALYYLAYALLSMASTLLFYFVSVKNQIYFYAVESIVSPWFIGLIMLEVLGSLLLAGIIQCIVIVKDRKIGKGVTSDTVNKYM